MSKSDLVQLQMHLRTCVNNLLLQLFQRKVQKSMNAHRRDWMAPSTKCSILWKGRKHRHRCIKMISWKIGGFFMPRDRKSSLRGFVLFCFILLTHKRSLKKVYRKFQPRYDIVRRSGAKGCSDHRFHAHNPSLYCQPIANSASTQSQQPVQRTAYQIKPTLRVSSNTQTTVKQSLIQVLTELNVAWLQWSYKNWYS